MKLLFLKNLRYGLFAWSLLLAGCSGGGSGSSGGNAQTSPSSGTPDFVAISGRVTYDRVPFSASAEGGLDYTAIQPLAARGVSVRLLDTNNNVLAAARTDSNGEYVFRVVAPNRFVKVRVFAELVKTSLPAWDVKVFDNTASNAQYVLDGDFFSSGIRDSVRNLHAASGWDNSLLDYAGTRAAAPFAILDTIFDGLQRIGEADAQLRLDLNPLNVFWSPLNRPAQGFLADGNIGTSFYRRFGADSRIYLLGDRDQDTEEYDDHVILHELAHYFEDSISRTDTIGGGHNIVESLDMRLAFSEGLANAFSGIVSDDPIYRDSFGFAQSRDFDINVELNPDPDVGNNAGWFVESSIHSLIYDFYDDSNEGDDTLSLGFQPIYDVLSSDDYINQSSFTTIFSFSNLLRDHASVDAAAVDTLLRSQLISGADEYGNGEMNDGGSADNLPVYSELVVNGGSQQVCTTNTLVTGREYNKLGNRQFLRFSTVSPLLAYTVVVAHSSGFRPSNPAFVLHHRGQVEGRIPEPNSMAYDTDGDSVSDLVTLDVADEYILEVFSRDNIDGDISTGGDVCFTVTVTR